MNTNLQTGARHGKVLLVDDQQANLRLMHQILAGDYELFVATSGVQALELCERGAPDLVLLDVVMPGLDGLEVCRRLKQHPDTRGIAVIFVTAGTTPEEENACWAAGGADFVTKPVNPLTLRHRVRAHLQLKQYVDTLHALAFVDGLTGIANRRHLNERLEVEWRRCLRSGMPLAVLMIDVDFFKRYNDRYGHQAGDDCLKRVAGALSSAMQRAGDLAGRYGGEEFLCLLPETDVAATRALAERVELAVRALAIEHLDSATAPVVTISVGAAVVHPGPDQAPATLLQRADAALYKAKQLGRGQAFVSDEQD
ncbi:diguanylate cyclase domain-containing protein [Duganella sp. S19_KUP01_CR8]|uniref:diguanylate cyclase domain-containing protein n=1 Tax=Duganella sp. S19_KUP01_CR8 TaxID=3025502 RepID=UPI002FCD7F5C